MSRVVVAAGCKMQELRPRAIFPAGRRSKGSSASAQVNSSFVDVHRQQRPGGMTRRSARDAARSVGDNGGAGPLSLLCSTFPSRCRNMPLSDCLSVSNAAAGLFTSVPSAVKSYPNDYQPAYLLLRHQTIAQQAELTRLVFQAMVANPPMTSFLSTSSEAPVENI